jgi:hypothetical protein
MYRIIYRTHELSAKDGVVHVLSAEYNGPITGVPETYSEYLVGYGVDRTAAAVDLLRVTRDYYRRASR